METLTATDVKNRFGDYLLKVQQEPIAIEKNGKPVAVTISMKEYKLLEEFKLERLRAEIKTGVDQIENGEAVDGEQVFRELLDEATP